MNIAEILKDCLKGTKLYSPVYGEVELLKVNPEYIIVQTSKSTEAYFDKQGRFNSAYDNAECLLFPSKDNRDWSTFEVHKKEYEFKPFDKVLVRDYNYNIWNIDMFSHINNNTKPCKYICLGNNWCQCIPYEGNEHLLGTTNNPD